MRKLIFLLVVVGLLLVGFVSAATPSDSVFTSTVSWFKGKLGIGIDNPSNELDVNGTVGIDGNLSVLGDNLTIVGDLYQEVSGTNNGYQILHSGSNYGFYVKGVNDGRNIYSLTNSSATGFYGEQAVGAIDYALTGYTAPGVGEFNWMYLNYYGQDYGIGIDARNSSAGGWFVDGICNGGDCPNRGGYIRGSFDFQGLYVNIYNERSDGVYVKLNSTNVSNIGVNVDVTAGATGAQFKKDNNEKTWLTKPSGNGVGVNYMYRNLASPSTNEPILLVKDDSDSNDRPPIVSHTDSPEPQLGLAGEGNCASSYEGIARNSSGIYACFNSTVYQLTS